MGRKLQRPGGRAELRANIKTDLVDQMVVKKVSDETIVGKTWKVRQGTVRRITELADTLGVNYGELVDWMLNQMVDDVHSGKVDVPINPVTVTVPVIQGQQFRGPRTKGTQTQMVRRQTKSRTQK